MEKSAGNNHAGSGWPWARENGESDGRPCLCECRPASQTGKGLQGSDFRSRAFTSVRNGEDHSGTMGRTIGKYQGPVGGNPHAPAYCHDARGTAETVSGCSEDGGISAKKHGSSGLDYGMGYQAGPPASSDALCRGQADIRRGRAFRLSRHGHKGLDEFHRHRFHHPFRKLGFVA